MRASMHACMYLYMYVFMYVGPMYGVYMYISMYKSMPACMYQLDAVIRSYELITAASVLTGQLSPWLAIRNTM
jgi:hypothetical protein